MSKIRTPNTTQLYVRSNIHASNLDLALKKHLHLQKFVDVTLSCEGRKFKCHRLILAAASPLLEQLLLDNPAAHPVLIMPHDIKAWTLQALIEFMYNGHVRVSQCGLNDLVRSAELLQISGLEHARKDFGRFCGGGGAGASAPKRPRQAGKRAENYEPDGEVLPQQPQGKRTRVESDFTGALPCLGKIRVKPCEMLLNKKINTKCCPAGSSERVTAAVQIKREIGELLADEEEEDENEEELEMSQADDVENIVCQPNMAFMHNEDEPEEEEEADERPLEPEELHYGDDLSEEAEAESIEKDIKQLSVGYFDQADDAKLACNDEKINKLEPSVETVVLRSPRTNQPRNYSTQALYNALMAVKHGESIYRASREYLVPRKTLRNWMKRWNIKSQYPMPKQLQDAAIRRKIIHAKTSAQKIH